MEKGMMKTSPNETDSVCFWTDSGLMTARENYFAVPACLSAKMIKPTMMTPTMMPPIRK